MTKEDAIFVLSCVEAHGLAEEARKMAVEALKSDPQKAYDQGVKDTRDEYDEICRMASEFRVGMGCNTAKECWELIRNHEIQRVKYGRWIKVDKHTVKCSKCGNYLDMRGVNAGRGDANYCPNCGAKMDGEDNG